MIIRGTLLIMVLILVSIRSSKSQGSTCGESETAGPDNPTSYDDYLDNDQGFGYLLYGQPYTISCCGTVRNWLFSIGDTGDIELQVWRPSGKQNQFTLVGLNQFTVQRKDRRLGYISFDVEAENVISVETGDVIGWYAPGDSLVEYSTDTEYNDIWKIQHDDSVTIGTQVDFSGGLKQEDRTFGIQVTMAPNRDPGFDLLLATSVRMDAEVGQVVYTVGVQDEDPGDGDNLVVELTTQHNFFNFDPQTGILSVATEMTVSESGEKIDLEFKVTDHCGAESYGTLTVNVDYTQRQTFPPKTKPTTVTATDATTTSKTTSKAVKTTEKKGRTTEEEQSDSTTTSTTVFTTTTEPVLTTTSNSTETEEQSSSAPLIGGIVAAVIIVIIAIAIVTVMIIKKRPRSKTSPDKQSAPS